MTLISIIIIPVMFRSDCEGLDPKEADCYRFKSPHYHYPHYLTATGSNDQLQ